jgi:hypothetical protein
MTHLVKTLDGHDLRCAQVAGRSWFCATDVATALGYNDKKRPVQRLPAEHKTTWAELAAQGASSPLVSLQIRTIFIDVAGLYTLVLRSQLPSAQTFRSWVSSILLPFLCASDAESDCPPPRAAPLHISNERHLHEAIVKYMRMNHPQVRVAAGLGELQRESDQRIEAWRKGYQKGQPDLLILARSGDFSGLAIELKTPTGQGLLSPEQQSWLDDLGRAGFQTLVSNDLLCVIGVIEAFLRSGA